MMKISCDVFAFGESIVGNHTELDSVSPCVHICGILFLSSPRGLMKYKPLSDVIATPPLSSISSGRAI